MSLLVLFSLLCFVSHCVGNVRVDALNLEQQIDLEAVGKSCTYCNMSVVGSSGVFLHAIICYDSATSIVNSLTTLNVSSGNMLADNNAVPGFTVDGIFNQSAMVLSTFRSHTGGINLKAYKVFPTVAKTDFLYLFYNKTANNHGMHQYSGTGTLKQKYQVKSTVWSPNIGTCSLVKMNIPGSAGPFFTGQICLYQYSNMVFGIYTYSNPTMDVKALPNAISSFAVDEVFNVNTHQFNSYSTHTGGVNIKANAIFPTLPSTDIMYLYYNISTKNHTMLYYRGGSVTPSQSYEVIISTFSLPTVAPTSSPSVIPTVNPSSVPSVRPTVRPTSRPSNTPAPASFNAQQILNGVNSSILNSTAGQKALRSTIAQSADPTGKTVTENDVNIQSISDNKLIENHGFSLEGINSVTILYTIVFHLNATASAQALYQKLKDTLVLAIENGNFTKLISSQIQLDITTNSVIISPLVTLSPTINPAVGVPTAVQTNRDNKLTTEQIIGICFGVVFGFLFLFFIFYKVVLGKTLFGNDASSDEITVAFTRVYQHNRVSWNPVPAVDARVSENVKVRKVSARMSNSSRGSNNSNSALITNSLS